MRLVFISDTHNLHENLRLPDGDFLFHTGDFSGRGRVAECMEFLDWFGRQPHRYKVLVAGNHDFMAEKYPEEFQRLIPENVIYLNDSGVILEGLKIWGSPVQPWFYDWAFNRKRGAEIRKHWDLIPPDTDILLVHGPPYNILDRVARDGSPVGCRDLLHRLDDISVKITAFGHIHEAYGKFEKDGKLFLNASVLDENYDLKNRPWVVDWNRLNTFTVVNL